MSLAHWNRDEFFEGFGNSGYSNILTQYFSGALPPTTALAGTGSDHSGQPETDPSVKRIAKEACKFIGGTVDPKGIYVTVITNFPVGAYYCAWHAFGKCNGSRIPVVYLPNVEDVFFGCGVDSAKRNPYSNAQPCTTHPIGSNEESKGEGQKETPPNLRHGGTNASCAGFAGRLNQSKILSVQFTITPQVPS